MRRSQARLKQTLGLQNEIVEHLGGGVVLARVSDDRIVYANVKIEGMFGYDPGELVGRHISVLNLPGSREPKETTAALLTALEEHGNWTGGLLNVRKDGSQFWSLVGMRGSSPPAAGLGVLVAVQFSLQSTLSAVGTT